MRTKSPLITILISVIVIPCLFGQENNDRKILLDINGNKITRGEFMWLYEKNNSGGTHSSIDDYLQMFINFKLKVEAANEAGIDKSVSFKRELTGYRKQLARNYLTDQDIKEELLKKAYERSKEEINAYHILIKCPADASPADTMSAWSKAGNIRERIRLGEPFEAVARGASDDPSVRINGGNLGYFTVFQTPITFENKVYGMKPGALSKPIRTADGYHIIKVQNRRQNSGRIKTAHIMKVTPPGITPGQKEKASEQIDSLYKMLLSGADFSKLAKEFSDDKGTSGNGGKLPWFGTGEMIFEFSEEAFRLMHNGDFSQPVQTVYGWHIIKRIDKQSPLPYSEARKNLESKLSQSYLASVTRKSFATRLKTEYNYKVNNVILEWFNTIADSTFRSGTYNWNTKHIPTETLYSFAGVTCSAADFADYINRVGNRAPLSDSISFINSLLDQKSYDDLIKYEDSILETKYSDFGYLINEFHDGILLFEISDSMIWSRSMNDTSGLMKYYETRKNEFMRDEAIKAKIYTISNKAGKNRTKKLIKTVKKYYHRDNGDHTIIELSIFNTDTLISITEDVYTKGSNHLTDQVKWTKGLSQVTDKTGTHEIYISSVTEAKPVEFEEAKPLIIDGYQKFLESEWLKQLHLKYNVIVYDDVLKTIKH